MRERPECSISEVVCENKLTYLKIILWCKSGYCFDKGVAFLFNQHVRCVAKIIDFINSKIIYFIINSEM